MTTPLFSKATFLGSLAGLGFLLGALSGAIATPPTASPPGVSSANHPEHPQFVAIAQPLWTKVTVTLLGLGLISLELWWFLLHRPATRKAKVVAGVQEVAVTVDGGYAPSQIVVQAGQPVRLNFTRHDPSSCLEEVRLPDFRIARKLPVNQTIPIEFTPNQPGKYEFTCGMNMFRGTMIAVESLS